MGIDYELINNEEDSQYEFHIDGLVPRLEYIKVKDKIFLTHTDIPKGLEGKNIAKTLVQKVLEDVERKKLSVIPQCPFVTMYIKRHPEWNKLVYEGNKKG